VKQGILRGRGHSLSCGLCSCNASFCELGFRASKNPFTEEGASAMSINNVEIVPEASFIEDSLQPAKHCRQVEPAGNALSFSVQRSFGPRG